MSAKGDYVGELNCSSGYRQGWGEMRWANGTFYGPGNIFIYSQGDRYFGQWIRNKQEGMFYGRTFLSENFLSALIGKNFFPKKSKANKKAEVMLKIT